MVNQNRYNYLWGWFVLIVNEETLADFRVLSVRKPSIIDAEKDFEWICRSFGFLESRDKMKTAYNIFRVIVETSTDTSGITSDELAEKLHFSRGTIIHHLNKLTKSGLIIHHESKYKLRGTSLKNTIEEIQRDVNRIFEDLESISASMDEILGFTSR